MIKTPEPEPLKDKAFELDPQVSAEEGSAFWYKDVKSACEFFLKYWDRPALLLKEQPQYRKELLEISPYFEKGKLYLIDDDEMAEYNEWLFKLAFADVFAEKERDEK